MAWQSQTRELRCLWRQQPIPWGHAGELKMRGLEPHLHPMQDANRPSLNHPPCVNARRYVSHGVGERKELVVVVKKRLRWCRSSFSRGLVERHYFRGDSPASALPIPAGWYRSDIKTLKGTHLSSSQYTSYTLHQTVLKKRVKQMTNPSCWSFIPYIIDVINTAPVIMFDMHSETTKQGGEELVIFLQEKE